MQAQNKLFPEVVVTAQEIEISRALACNDAVKRNKQLKKLQKWLTLRSKSSFSFTEEDFMCLWKGLYYNLWYADKPLVQEQIADRMGQLLYSFDGNIQLSIDFFNAFLKTMNNEWFGIDRWRMDKFLMLVRRMLRHIFQILKSVKWSAEMVEIFNKHTSAALLSDDVVAKGLTYHYLDIFLEELAKVSNGSITAADLNQFLVPFAKYLITQKEFDLIHHCRIRIFHHLLYQSELGREYSDKFNAWKEMGFPTSNIDDLVLVEDDNNDDTEDNDDIDMDVSNELTNTDIDPRAGNVDVIMPTIPFNATSVIDVLEMSENLEMPIKRRKFLRNLIHVLKVYQTGKFPLGVKQVSCPSKRKPLAPLVEQKIDDLDILENEMYGVNRKLKKLNKRKRRLLLKSLNYDKITEENLDETIDKELSKGKLSKLQRLKEAQKRLMNDWKVIPLDKEDLLIQKKIEANAECSKKTKNFNKSKIKLLHSKYNNGKKKSLKERVFVENRNETDTCPKKKIKHISEWDEPLKKGETEIFLPSRKHIVKHLNAKSSLSISPSKSATTLSTLKSNTSKDINTTKPSTSQITKLQPKRVRIALNHNTSQKPHEYLQQLKSSPDVPFDASKKPLKSVLKPNAQPSPINPFYNFKINKFLNRRNPNF